MALCQQSESPSALTPLNSDPGFLKKQTQTPKGGKMKFLVLLFSIFLFSANANADQFAVAVKYLCDSESDILSIKYVGAWNSDGDKLIEGLGPDDWDPWNLFVENEYNDLRYAITAKRTCSLSSGAYHVTVGPTPEIWNAQGECGATLTAWAEIKKDANILFKRSFEGWCHGSDPVIREVRVRGSNGVAEVESVSQDEFYKD